jgi:hypothetical protein
MCPKMEYPLEYKRISRAPSLPTQKCLTQQCDGEAQLNGALIKKHLRAQHAGEEEVE